MIVRYPLPRRTIPVVGEVRTAAELVEVLKRAVAERHGLAEHEVDLDDRYVATAPRDTAREAA